MLSSAFAGVDKDATAVVGRIEENRFVRERGDFYAFLHDRSRGHRSGGTSTWGQAITAPDGRVLRLHTIAENPGSCDMFTANDIVRMGWRNVHSMPHEVCLENNELAFRPAVEFEGLRRESLYSSKAQEIGKDEEWFANPGGNRAHIEVRCSFLPSPGSISGIVLEAGEKNRLRFYYDRDQSLLVLDYSQSNALVKSQMKTELKLAPGEEADLRLFFDASVIEVFANGERSFGRWYTGSPDEINVGLFSEDAPACFSRVDVWEMGTIWKAYQGPGNQEYE